MPASSKRKPSESQPFVPKSSEEAEEAYRNAAKLLRELMKDKNFGMPKAEEKKR